MPVACRPWIQGLTEFYDFEQRIGKGGFGTVYKAVHKLTGENVAVKIMDKGSSVVRDDLHRVLQEIDVLKTLDHPNICKIYKAGQTEQYIFIVMEYCAGGELFDYLVSRDRLSENEARRIIIEILKSVQYLHDFRGVAHRDLKPENVLLDFSNNIKLIDFGLCSKTTNLLKTACGSYAYAAPELYLGREYDGKLTDIWSLGCILYVLLTGRLPFEATNDREIMTKALHEDYPEPKWLSEGAKCILRCMLAKDPDHRVSAKNLLTHTWCREDRDLIASSEPTFLDPAFKKLDDDVLLVMAQGLARSAESLEAEIRRWDYSSENVAIYCMLCSRKQMCGSLFRSIPLRNGVREQELSKVKKSLQDEFESCDDADNSQTPVLATRKYHTSMEGGLDDVNLLEFASPKNKEKDGEGNERFLRPRVPSPKKQKASEAVPFPTGNIAPAKSADSGLNDAPRTPAREKWMAMDPHTPVGSYPSPSPSRRKILGSIERGLDKVKNMLTPRSAKSKRMKTLKYTGRKEAFNVTSTEMTDGDCVLEQLKQALGTLGATYKEKENGYCLIGKWQERVGDDKIFTGRQVKFELEVMLHSENTPQPVVGIRRKRVNGDAFLYKSVVERILNLTGVCQLPRKEEPQPPARLQTMV